MKSIRKFVVLLLAVAMVFSMAATASASGTFSDVPATLWCYDAVNYAVQNSITTGIGNGMFAPDATCTRGQIVTFLWRAKGCPEPAGSNNPFVDVKETDFFYKAVLWAVENGVTAGSCRNCDHVFTLDVTLTEGDVQTEITGVTSNNYPYTCVIERISISEPELIVESNVPKAEYVVRVYFDYIKDPQDYFGSITPETIYLKVYDSDGTLVASYAEEAHATDSYAYFSKVCVPGNGEYTVNVSFRDDAEA